ncbi:MAG: hypothetical protein ACR2M1_06300 [Gemmatimonadaceae bacterium]
MANDESVGAKMAAAATLTAVLFSPRMRALLRHGAVNVLAGALAAGDAISSFAQGVSRGVQERQVPLAETGSDHDDEESRADQQVPTEPVLFADEAPASPKRQRTRRSPSDADGAVSTPDTALDAQPNGAARE